MIVEHIGPTAKRLDKLCFYIYFNYLCIRKAALGQLKVNFPAARLH